MSSQPRRHSHGGAFSRSRCYCAWLLLAPLLASDWRALPLTTTARTLAMIEAVVGQFYVAVVVAIFVGMYSMQRRGPA